MNLGPSPITLASEIKACRIYEQTLSAGYRERYTRTETTLKIILKDSQNHQ